MRPFAYHRAGGVADAIARLDGGAAILAGGTTMVDLMKLEVLTPSTLVDIAGIAELAGFDTSGDPLRFGALARMADVAPHGRLARLRDDGDAHGRRGGMAAHGHQRL